MTGPFSSFSFLRTDIFPFLDKPELQNVYTGPVYNMTIDKQCNVNGSECHNVTVPVTCYGGLFPEDAYAKFTLPEVTCTSETGKKKNPGPNGMERRGEVRRGKD
jgi:hypothetical protein